MMKEEESLRSKQQNMSISIMVLSAEAKQFHAKHYQKLCEMTKEGIFVNIVKKETADKVADRFFSTMDVYPSNQHVVIREFFGTM